MSLSLVTSRERDFILECNEMCGFYNGWAGVVDMLANAIELDCNRLTGVPWQANYREALTRTAKLLRDTAIAHRQLETVK